MDLNILLFGKMKLKIILGIQMNISKIKSIKKITENSTRYDLTVEDFSCYFANNILVHNTDGQNLMFSWIDGKLKVARNAGHLKNFGKAALDISGISNMFSGRGEIQTAFTEASKDLEKAISQMLKEREKDKEEFNKREKELLRRITELQSEASELKSEIEEQS